MELEPAVLVSVMVSVAKSAVADKRMMVLQSAGLKVGD